MDALAREQASRRDGSAALPERVYSEGGPSVNRVVHDRKVRCARNQGTLHRGHVPPWQRSEPSLGARGVTKLPERYQRGFSIIFSVHVEQVAMCPQGSKRIVLCMSMHTVQLYRTEFAS